MLTLYRIIPGIVFIFSGFMKAADPVGTALKIDEYLAAFHLSFFDFLSLPVAVVLSGAEFVIGISLLKGINIKRVAPLSLVLISFFTLLTLYAAIFNPVKECGCFGEALRLSNVASLCKNIVLLLFVVMAFINRDKYSPIALPFMERIYTYCYCAFIFLISLWSVLYIPQVDFTPLKVGTDLEEALPEEIEREFQTTFIYSKDGREEEFGLENLPDSTWNFVAANTVQISGRSANDPSANFVLKDGDGNYVTEQILSEEGPLFFISIYNGARTGEKYRKRVAELCDTLMAHGRPLYAVTGDADIAWDLENVPLLFTDYKTSLSLNRSNGGLVEISDKTIIAKWGRIDFPTERVSELLKKDPEVVSANKVIGEQLFIELSFIIIFALVFVVRYISKRYYLKYLAAQERG